MDAQKISEFMGINCVTVNRIFGKIRERLVSTCESESPFVNGKIELDESYFGARRVGLRGRGAKDKIPVFGMLKRGDKVYTPVVTNCSMSELMPIIKGKEYYIPMVLRRTMDWLIMAIKSILWSNMERINLPMGITISMVLIISGGYVKSGSQS